MFPYGNRNVQIFFELAFFLIMLNLLEYLGAQLLTGFGLFGPVPFLMGYVSPLLNMVGVVLYLRFRMYRNIDYAGLSFDHGWGLPLAVGVVLGLALPLLASSVSVLFGGAGPGSLPSLINSRLFLLNLADTVLVLFLRVLAVELVHRGMIANRVTEEFPYWKALGFAMLFWALSYGFGGMVLWLPHRDPLGNGLLYLFSVLLFWRTQNLWWPVAVQLGNWFAFRFFFQSFPGLETKWALPHAAAVWLIWGAACAALIYLDWRGREQQGSGGGHRGFRTSGRMVRGPWGPH